MILKCLLAPYLDFNNLLKISGNLKDYRFLVKTHIMANYDLDDNERKEIIQVKYFRMLDQITYLRIFCPVLLRRKIKSCKTLDVREKVRLLQGIKKRRGRKELELFFQQRFLRKRRSHSLVEESVRRNGGVLVLGDLLIFESLKGFRIYSLRNRTKLLAQSYDGTINVLASAPPVVALMLKSPFVFEMLYKSRLFEEVSSVARNAGFPTIEFCKNFRGRIPF